MKLNVCIVLPKQAVYSETFIRNHIAYLPANVFDLYGSWFPVHDRNGHSLPEEFVNRHSLSTLFRLACKLLPSFLANRLPSQVKGYPFDEGLNEAAFRYFLKKKRIDVVLAEFMLKGVVIKNVCTELQIPFVVHTHGGGDIMNSNSLAKHRKDYEDLFQKAARIISVDSFSSAKLLELGLAKNKLVQIASGVDLGLFKPTKPSGNGLSFFAVGRFTDKKAPQLTILAFAEVVKKYPAAQLTFGGAGELREACRQIVRSLHLDGNVFFPGILTPEQVAATMQKSRVFLQHSIHTTEGDSEGTPVVILEAMASGLPVVSTWHNGIADTIEHGVNGLLVAENDIRAMADSMIKLIEDPPMADRIGGQARKTVETSFEMSKIIGHLYQILEDVAMGKTSVKH